MGTISADPDVVGSGNPFLAVRNVYDAQGRLIKVQTGTLASWQSEAVAPANWSGFIVYRTLETDYDVMGRKLVERLREGSAGTIHSVTQYSYDALGRLVCTAVRMNTAAFSSLPSSACALGSQGTAGQDRITRNSYDGAGRLWRVETGYGTSQRRDQALYTYTLNGLRASVTEASGARAELRYDGHDRLVRWVFPNASTAGLVNEGDYEEYVYDPAGNRRTFRRRDGSTLTYEYDGLNRMSWKIVPERSGLSSTHTRDVYYGYDLLGRQLHARFDSHSGEGVTTAYDALARPTSSTLAMDGASRTLSYENGPAGPRSRITWPDNFYVSYDYDGINRLTLLREYGTTSLVALGYHAHGALSSRLGEAGAAGLTDVQYDGVQRPSAITHNLPGSASDVSWTFGRNPAAQLSSVTRSNDAYAWTGHVATNRPYTVNRLNQYTSAGGTTFGYDVNGNLTASGSDTYVYDVENRLVAASGSHSAALRYDPLGRLYEVTGGGITTRFLYDGDALVAEYNSAGSLVRRHVHGSDAVADDPLVTYEGGTRRSLYADHQGSIVASATTGAVSLNAYDEYGIPNPGWTVSGNGRFGYTGQAWLAELGMWHYKARIYSPTLGRFLQTDPIGYEDQINLYAYVRNDPVNLLDSSGQFTIKANSTAQARRLEPMINRYAAGAYRFNAQNELERVGPSEQSGATSVLYDNDLSALIASPQTVMIGVATNVTEPQGVENVDARYNGGITYTAPVPGQDVQVVVSGNSANAVAAADGGTLNQDPGQILMHEIVQHARPYVDGSSGSTNDENRVRKELGLPFRGRTAGHD